MRERAIARFASLRREARVEVLPDLSQRVDRRVALSRIEVVITDFVVSPDTLAVVDLIRI